jgi:hypothetical protein
MIKHPSTSNPNCRRVCEREDVLLCLPVLCFGWLLIKEKKCHEMNSIYMHNYDLSLCLLCVWMICLKHHDLMEATAHFRIFKEDLDDIHA